VSHGAQLNNFCSIPRCLLMYLCIICLLLEVLFHFLLFLGFVLILLWRLLE
jgi:hypothetical protein